MYMYMYIHVHCRSWRIMLAKSCIMLCFYVCQQEALLCSNYKAIMLALCPAARARLLRKMDTAASSATSSARVFSLLSNFSDRQQSALEGYVEAALIMLQYNTDFLCVCALVCCAALFCAQNRPLHMYTVCYCEHVTDLSYSLCSPKSSIMPA